VIAGFDEACANGARRRQAGEVLGLTLRYVQRWQKEDKIREDGRQATAQRHIPANALTPAEREPVLQVVNRPEFADLSPKPLVPRLADPGESLASESSFYRLLREEQRLAHRGQAKPATHRRPEPRVATGPNPVWTGNITDRATPVRGVFFYLDLILDLFSRKIVGWEVHRQQSCRPRRGTVPSVLPMKGVTLLATRQRLGVMPFFSRSSVSNDTPCSVPSSTPRPIPMAPSSPSTTPAPGSHASSPGITASTSTVPSRSSPRSNVIGQKSRTCCVDAPRWMRPPKPATPPGGPVISATGSPSIRSHSTLESLPARRVQLKHPDTTDATTYLTPPGRNNSRETHHLFWLAA
jgi:putative transposase